MRILYSDIWSNLIHKKLFRYGGIYDLQTCAIINSAAKKKRDWKHTYLKSQKTYKAIDQDIQHFGKIVKSRLPYPWRPVSPRQRGCNRIVNTWQNEQFAHGIRRYRLLVVSRRSINIYAISFIRAALKRDTRVNALGSRGASRLQTHATGSNVVLQATCAERPYLHRKNWRNRMICIRVMKPFALW